MKNPYVYDYLFDSESVYEVKRFIKQYRRLSDLRVDIVDNGIILPKKESNDNHIWMGLGGVLDEKERYIELSGIRHASGNGNVFGGKYDFDRNSLKYSDLEVIYLGPLFNHWGHFLVDFITRLWYYVKIQKLPIAYCGWGFDEGRLFGGYKRFFELLGIQESDMIDVRVPTRFKRIIIPEQSYVRDLYDTKEYEDIIECVISQIDTSGLVPHEKIYISREKFIRKNKWSYERGEKAISNTFSKNGFFVFDPAFCSLDEQIFYIKNAKVIAGLTSSNMINTIFASKRSDRIYIKKNYEMENEAVHMDAITLPQTAYLIDGFLIPYPKYRPSISVGPHLVGMTKELKKFLKDCEMITLPSLYYIKENLITYIWFALAVTYKKMYSVYYMTLRKMIKKELLE